MRREINSMCKSEKVICFLKKEWFLLLLIITNFIGGWYFNPKLPGMLPSHWNIAGQVDRYSPKLMITLGFPAIALGIYLMMLIIPHIDPKKRNYDLFGCAYLIIRSIILAFFSLMIWATIFYGLGYALDISKIVVISIGILFIVLGNYMGRVRQNFFVGIRTPWTLSSEEIWAKTHRLAGKLWVAAGIIMMVGIFFSGTVTFAIMLAFLLYPVIYSYILYVKMQKN
jgi:uncharacterized membrane protein